MEILGTLKWLPCIKKDGEGESEGGGASETPYKSSGVRSQQSALLIIAASKNSCLLMNEIPDKRLIGSMVLPKQEATVGVSGSERASEKACQAFELEKLREKGEKGGGGDVIAICAEDVPANQAVALTKALFQIFKPRRVVALGAIGLGSLRNQVMIDSAPLFFLETDASKRKRDEQRNQYSVPLPSGNVIDGLVAAVMTYCQVRDMDAAAFLRLEQFGATVGDSGDPLTIMSMLLESFSTIPPFSQVVNVNNVLKATSAAISEKALKGPLSDIFV